MDTANTVPETSKMGGATDGPEETPELFPRPPKKPTKSQIAEVVDPSLSLESFTVGDDVIPIRILPYSSEKRMILCAEPLIKKIMELLGADFSEPGKEKGKSLYEIFKDNGLKLVTEFADEIFSVVHVIAYAAFFTPRCGTPLANAWLPSARDY